MPFGVQVQVLSRAPRLTKRVNVVYLEIFTNKIPWLVARDVL